MKRSATLLFILIFLSTLFAIGQKASSVKGKTICIDAGHGGTALTDHYRVGAAGEREELVNLRVAQLLQKILTTKGARVLMTRTADSIVTLPARAKVAVDQKADIFISIHHNATADTSVNFPIIYFHGNATENEAGVRFGKLLARELITKLYSKKTSDKTNMVSVVSDFTVFAEAGASVLRNTYGIPAVLAEASFFTNPTEEQKLKQTEHNQHEAQAYAEALEAFFAANIPKIFPKNAVVPAIPPFKVFQEAERMTPIAKRWRQDFLEAKQLASKKDTSSLTKAYALFTRSARSFPDSYVAAICHAERAKILSLQGKPTEAQQEAQRAREYYPNWLK
jgi:N-acetylmuramoyl-L-alanine amidase